MRKKLPEGGILQPFATVQMVHFPLYRFATAGKKAISFSNNFPQDERQPILRSSDIMWHLHESWENAIAVQSGRPR